MLQDMGYHNVLVLDMSTYTDGDYLFVCATLWTDMNKGDALAMYNMPNFMSHDGKIAYETGLNGGWSKFTSEKWVNTFRKHRDYIKHVVTQNKDKKIVVITHHLPLMTLGDPCYAADSSNAYYMSDLSDIILDNDNIVMWCYGHTHHQKDIFFPDYADVGDGCRMINNAVGYQGQHFEQQNLVVHEVLSI